MSGVDRNAQVLDQIALGLGTKDEWDSGELEWIADLVGTVRPFPGFTGGGYVAQFTAARGFDPRKVPALADFIEDDDDETIGGPS